MSKPVEVPALGVTYVVVPLSPSLHAYLDAQGAPYPSEAGRRPTLLDLRAAIAGLPEVTADFDVPPPGGTWFATLEAAPSQPSAVWTVITAHPFCGETSEYDLAFERGAPELIVSVLHVLSTVTGPLVLVPDTGATPLVISPHRTVPELLASWADDDVDAPDEDDLGPVT